MVQVGQSPASLEDQPGNFCHLGEVNLIHGVSRLVVVDVDSIKIKNHRDTVFGVVPVVGAIVNALWVAGIVVVVVQREFLILGVGILTDLVQLFADPVGADQIDRVCVREVSVQ